MQTASALFIIRLTGMTMGIGYLVIFFCVILVFGLFGIRYWMEEKFLLMGFGEEYTGNSGKSKC